MEIKREVKDRESEIKPMVKIASGDIPFSNITSSVELLDSIMKARDELFEVQLKDDLGAHRKLAGLLMK